MSGTSKIDVVGLPNIERSFTATNVLSVDECAAVVAVAEAAGFRNSGEANGPRFAGNRMRSSFMDSAVAEVLFERLKPWLPSSHRHDCRRHDHHLLGPKVPSGTYTPIGVNEFLRISKYMPNGDFRKHTDTGYVRDDQYVGFWTLLLYLNDDFEGGETVIYDNNYKKVTIKPETGKVFAFYHYELHAGLVVKSGEKMCLRTEIMFART